MEQWRRRCTPLYFFGLAHVSDCCSWLPWLQVRTFRFARGYHRDGLSRNVLIVRRKKQTCIRQS